MAKPLTDPSRDVSALTLDGYVQHIADVNNVVLTHHLFGAERLLMRFRGADGTTQVYINGPIVYFWMRDDKEAIFAIVPLGAGPGFPLAVAFYTLDPTMIGALNGIYGRYRSAARPFEDTGASAGEHGSQEGS